MLAELLLVLLLPLTSFSQLYLVFVIRSQAISRRAAIFTTILFGLIASKLFFFDIICFEGQPWRIQLYP